MKSNKKNIAHVRIGINTKVNDFVNLYGCEIGNNSMIGAFVEIQKNVVIGNNVKVESHTFICSGVMIKDNVFIGHHVVFINDKYPRAVSIQGTLKTEKDWELLQTIVEKGASIGSNTTILGGVTIGKDAIVGAGSVVTKNVLSGEVVAGNPAKKLVVKVKNKT